MYAVIASGGKQYRVEKGDVVRMDRLSGEVGANVKFDSVLMLGDGDNSKVGQPLLSGAEVKGEIVAQDLGKKIIIFKMRRRKGYRRKTGHRQPYTAVRVTDIKG
ncbi:MAG: 50S ribosomal protein L21 [Myxococcales bacterium]|nr:MAG: 50S ribosomal protein L21 [Myxococcales bacterium]